MMNFDTFLNLKKDMLKYHLEFEQLITIFIAEITNFVDKVTPCFQVIHVLNFWMHGFVRENNYYALLKYLPIFSIFFIVSLWHTSIRNCHVKCSYSYYTHAPCTYPYFLDIDKLFLNSSQRKHGHFMKAKKSIMWCKSETSYNNFFL